MNEYLQFAMHYGEGNGNPLQCSCLENPRDRGAWWAAVYGVAQSWTRLKRLSSSSMQRWIIKFYLQISLWVYMIDGLSLHIKKLWLKVNNLPDVSYPVIYTIYSLTQACQVVLMVKNPPANADKHKRCRFNPGLGRSPGGGHSNPPQYSCLKSPMDRGA